ncbi:hypothetical protein N7461_001911 [Penicillium sp. DV-2018c]|nr:hypothetical protein N7461_001911 [Penicillium sp. DV-2018c]
MEQPSVDRPKPKVGRPRKYTTDEQRKAARQARTARERVQRQAARAAATAGTEQPEQPGQTGRPLRIIQYQPPAAPQSTGINQHPPSYFPPGELSIATEVEQFLPPLSPGLEPEEPFALEDLPRLSVDDALPLDTVPDVSIETTWTDPWPQTAASQNPQAAQRSE